MSLNDLVKQRAEELRKKPVTAEDIVQVSEDDLGAIARQRTLTSIEQEKIRESQPSYFQARLKYDKQKQEQISFDTRYKNSFLLKNALLTEQPEVLKEDLDGIFGGKNLISKFFLGTGIKPEDLGKESKISQKGLLGFIAGTLLKSTPELEAELYETLLDAGADPESALQKSKVLASGQRPQDLSLSELSAVQSFERWETVFKTIEGVGGFIDLMSMGGTSVLRKAVKETSRSGIRNIIKESTKVTTRKELRDIITKEFPKMSGSKELEQMIDIINSFPEDFSLLKARQDFQLTETFKKLSKTVKPTQVIPDTEAQKGLFRTGRPALKTVEGGAEAAYEARKSITSALRGEREAERLSNSNVFLSEVRAGALPRAIEIGDKIDAFLVGGRGRVGKQVVLSKDLAKEGAETIRVAVDDLVRLPDGTFTIVPKAQIGRDLTPSLKAIKDITTREAVAKTEARDALRKQMEEIASKQAKKQAERELAERTAREEAVRVANAEKLAKAKEVVESAKIVTKGTLSKLRTQADRAIRAIQATEKKIIKFTQTRKELLQSSTKKADLTKGRFLQKFGKYMTVTEKNKVRAGKSLTTAERARIQKRIREAIDKEIDALKVSKNELQANWRQAGSDLAKAKSLLKEADEAKTVLKQSDEAIKAEKKVKTETKKFTQAEKAKTTANEVSEEITKVFKENFKATREEVVDTVKTHSGGTTPLKGDGDEIANQIFKGIQKEADEAYRVLGVEGGFDAVKTGTAKINAEALEKIPLVHRIASNEQQLKSAITRVIKDPESAYFDFINSRALDDSMAALYSVLIRSDFILDDVTRLNNLVRQFDKFGTRTAQELQARQMIGRLDYPNLISRMMRKGDDILKKRGINMGDEVAKIEKALGDEFDKLATISKSEALEQLNKITCDV